MILRKKKINGYLKIEKLKEGDYLLAIKDSFMTVSKSIFLIKNKKYKIKEIIDEGRDKYVYIIESEFSKNHRFGNMVLLDFFKL